MKNAWNQMTDVQQPQPVTENLPPASGQQQTQQIQLKVQQQKPTFTSFGVIEVGKKTWGENLEDCWEFRDEEEKQVFFSLLLETTGKSQNLSYYDLGLSCLTDIIVVKAWGSSQWPLWLGNVPDNSFFMPSEMNAGFTIYTPWSRPDNNVADEPQTHKSLLLKGL